MAFLSGFKQNLREIHDVAHTDRTVSMRGRRLGRIGMGRGSRTRLDGLKSSGSPG